MVSSILLVVQMVFKFLVSASSSIYVMYLNKERCRACIVRVGMGCSERVRHTWHLKRNDDKQSAQAPLIEGIHLVCPSSTNRVVCPSSTNRGYLSCEHPLCHWPSFCTMYTTASGAHVTHTHAQLCCEIFQLNVLVVLLYSVDVMWIVIHSSYYIQSKCFVAIVCGCEVEVRADYNPQRLLQPVEVFCYNCLSL